MPATFRPPLSFAAWKASLLPRRFRLEILPAKEPGKAHHWLWDADTHEAWPLPDEPADAACVVFKKNLELN